jgi:hypothetical protein
MRDRDRDDIANGADRICRALAAIRDMLAALTDELRLTREAIEKADPYRCYPPREKDENRLTIRVVNDPTALRD